MSSLELIFPSGHRAAERLAVHLNRPAAAVQNGENQVRRIRGRHVGVPGERGVRSATGAVRLVTGGALRCEDRLAVGRRRARCGACAHVERRRDGSDECAYERGCHLAAHAVLSPGPKTVIAQERACR